MSRGKACKLSMIAIKGELCLFVALLLLISCCQGAGKNYNNNRERSDGRGGDESMPWMYLMMTNGVVSTAATPGIYVLSMLSLGLVYYFRQLHLPSFLLLQPTLGQIYNHKKSKPPTWVLPT